MNLSVDFMQSERPDQAFYGAIRRENRSTSVSDATYLRRPATRPGICWVRSPCAQSVTPRTFNAHEPLGYQMLPPLPAAVACGDFEPHVVRLVDGEDAPMRKKALETCVRQLGAARGRRLLVRCKRGELEQQLGHARAWAEKRCDRFPSRPVVVGIDGIDQWLTSPVVAARQLQAILHVGATVACGVDARYVDSLLLTLQLRVLGIMVIREAVVPGSLTSVSPAPDMHCSSADSKSGRPVRSFPYVNAPALAAHVAERKNPGAQTPLDNSLDQRALKQRGATEGAARWALSGSERVECARAYRSNFAINRLLREHFGS